MVPRVTGSERRVPPHTLKAAAADADDGSNERNGRVIRQLPPGPRRPPALEVASAPGRADVLACAVRSGGYRPPLDAVVEALLPWIVTVDADGRARPGPAVQPRISGAAH
jgi:hypothetical protein